MSCHSPFSPCRPFSRDADGDFIVEASIEVRGADQARATAAGMAAADQGPSLLQRPATCREGRIVIVLGPTVTFAAISLYIM
jgi:hypothetical protein